MGSITNLDKDNIITATMEELTEEEHKSYLVADDPFVPCFFFTPRIHSLLSPTRGEKVGPAGLGGVGQPRWGRPAWYSANNF